MLKLNDDAVFDLLSWLEGRTFAEGVFEDRKGRLRRRFTVEMNGRADGGKLTLEENFVFDDGERQRRVWTLHRGSGHTFSGRSDDSASDARGSFETGVAYLASELKIKVGNRAVAMRFDDAFYVMAGGGVLNRSKVMKWGIALGQVVMALRKKDQRSP